MAGNYFGTGADGDVVYSSSTNLTSTLDGDYVVKNYNSLTVNSGVTLTTSNRCKGLFIYVKENCSINGTLSMSNRGAFGDPITAGVLTTGIRLALRKSGSTDTLSAAEFTGCGATVISAVANQPTVSGNGKIFQIVRTGGAGGLGQVIQADGLIGGSIADGAGGGGGGGHRYTSTPWSGRGGNATCFSGGPGGGGQVGGYTPASTAGSDIGGAGGDGNLGGIVGGGGAGNPGGGGGAAGENGTGGIIWLIVGGNLTIGAAGVLEAKGARGGEKSAAGGCSGGGVIKVAYAGTLSNSGSFDVSGGVDTVSYYSDGGTGGLGTYELVQVDASYKSIGIFMMSRNF